MTTWESLAEKIAPCRRAPDCDHPECIACALRPAIAAALQAQFEAGWKARNAAVPHIENGWVVKAHNSTNTFADSCVRLGGACATLPGDEEKTK